jgi:paraquat-inducible protein B
MRKTPNKKMIGLFTLTGIICFFGIIATLLSSRMFVRDKDLIVTYFDESIKGLSVGSPVVLQGVEIGRVYRINLIANPEDLTFKIPVFIQIDKAQFNSGENQATLSKFIEKGLRARLATRNILTGQLIIEFVMLPNSKAVLRGDGHHLEIPTVLSSFGAISRGFDDLPLKETFEKLNKLLGQGSRFVSEINDSSTVSSLNKTIKDIGLAAQSLRNLTDYLEMHPEALLRGKH